MGTTTTCNVCGHTNPQLALATLNTIAAGGAQSLCSGLVVRLGAAEVAELAATVGEQETVAAD